MSPGTQTFFNFPAKIFPVTKPDTWLFVKNAHTAWECHGALHHLLYLFFSYLFFSLFVFIQFLYTHTNINRLSKYNRHLTAKNTKCKRHHQQSDHCQTKSCPFGIQAASALDTILFILFSYQLFSRLRFLTLFPQFPSTFQVYGFRIVFRLQ